jgi:hypothetical protein
MENNLAYLSYVLIVVDKREYLLWISEIDYVVSVNGESKIS